VVYTFNPSCSGGGGRRITTQGIESLPKALSSNTSIDKKKKEKKKERKKVLNFLDWEVKQIH
jgi:hypothetical protein